MGLFRVVRKCPYKTSASPPAPLQRERGVDSLAALVNRPHRQSLFSWKWGWLGCFGLIDLTPTPLRGERGVDGLAALVVINVILGYYSLLAMPKQGYSLPSPLGEGLGVRPVWVGGEAFLSTTSKHILAL